MTGWQVARNLPVPQEMQPTQSRPVIEMNLTKHDGRGVTHDTKKAHLHFFDDVESYRHFVHALPAHALHEAVGAVHTATQAPFALSLTAPVGGKERWSNNRHAGWAWPDARSLLLGVVDHRSSAFPDHIEIDATRDRHAVVAGTVMVVTLTTNTELRRHSAIVRGFLDAHTSLVAIVTASTAEGRDALLDCLGSLIVTRATRAQE